MALRIDTFSALLLSRTIIVRTAMDRIGRFKLPRRVARVMKHVGAADGGSQDDEDYDALDGGSTRCHYTPHRFELAAFSLRFWTGAAAELDYPVSQQSIVREPQPTIGFQPLSQFARCDAGPFYLCPRQFAFTSVGDCAMLVSRWGSHPRQRPQDRWVLFGAMGVQVVV